MEVVRSTLGERRWAAVRAWSIVHESSDQDNPYDHTHAAFMLTEAPDISGNDLFRLPELEPETDEKEEEEEEEKEHGGGADPEGDAAPKHEGQPHINHSLSVKWMENLFTDYHQGWKVDNTKRPRKKKFIEPVGLWQKVPQDLRWHEEAVREVIKAPTFLDAVFTAGARVERISDVAVLRREASAGAPVATAKFKIGDFEPRALAETPRWAGTVPSPVPSRGERLRGALHVWGPTLLGKTQFALALVPAPLLIKNINKLKFFDPRVHKSIIFDEANLSKLSREEALGLVEYENPADVRVLYAVVTIPAGVLKVFLSNGPNIFPHDEHGAIANRVASYHVTQPLFN